MKHRYGLTGTDEKITYGETRQLQSSWESSHPGIFSSVEVHLCVTPFVATGSRISLAFVGKELACLLSYPCTMRKHGRVFLQEKEDQLIPHPSIGPGSLQMSEDSV